MAFLSDLFLFLLTNDKKERMFVNNSFNSYKIISPADTKPPCLLDLQFTIPVAKLVIPDDSSENSTGLGYVGTAVTRGIYPGLDHTF